LCRGHARAEIVFDVQVEMGFHLGGEFAFSAVSTKEVA
jgi:hypothetical protein